MDMIISELSVDELAKRANFIHNNEEPLNGIPIKGGDDFWYRLVGLERPEALYIVVHDHSNDFENAKAFYLDSRQFLKGLNLNKDAPTYFGEDVKHLLIFQMCNISDKRLSNRSINKGPIQ